MSEVDRTAYARMVREVLAHLQDHVYLQLHPLANLLGASSSQRSQHLTLYRILIEAIEMLRPAPHASASDPGWRPYHAIFLHYVEGLDVHTVAEELAISPRQFRREKQRGLEALTDLLWARYQQYHNDSTAKTYPYAALHHEVARLHAATADQDTIVLDHVVQSAITTLAELSAARGVQITSLIPENLPPVQIDRVVLRQVLLHVLLFMLDSNIGERIELTAHSVAHALEVEIGCSNHVLLNAIDERLTVATGLIEAQQGRLEIVCEHGWTARLTIPINTAPTVLVVDDNPDMIQLFRRYLSGSYHVTGVTTSAEAVSMARELLPQIITLDVMLPDQDGWELLQHFKHDPVTSNIPIIICSILRDQVLAQALGASDYLAKPVTREALLATLERYT